MDQNLANPPTGIDRTYRTIPRHYVYQLYIIIGLFCLGFLFGLAAAYVRLRDKGRRFLVKRTERTEGVYVVPHSPLLAAFFIMVECGLSLAITVVTFFFWSYGQVKARELLRIMGPIMPLPLWAWVWLSLFGPVYAVHLFPVETLTDATSRRTARCVRFRPKVINAACYGAPFVVAVPAVSLSIAWGLLWTKGLDDQNIGLQNTAARIYQAMWSVWLFIFVFTCALYILYSVLLIKILNLQLSTLNHFDNAIQEAKNREVQPPPGLASTISAVFQANASTLAMHQISTHDHSRQPTRPSSRQPSVVDFGQSPLPSPAHEKPHEKPAAKGQSPARPQHRRLGSIFARRSRESEQKLGQNSISSTLKQYSKLDLLRLNTRLIIFEACIFSFFCFAWCCFTVGRIQVGLGIRKSNFQISTVFLVQCWTASTFAFSAAFVIWRRGLSISRMPKDEEEQQQPQDQQPHPWLNNRFNPFGQLLLSHKGEGPRDGVRPLDVTLTISEESTSVPIASTYEDGMGPKTAYSENGGEAALYTPLDAAKGDETPLARRTTIDDCVTTWSCPPGWDVPGEQVATDPVQRPVTPPVSPRSIKTVFWMR